MASGITTNKFSIFKVQKRISYIVSALGMLVVFINFFDLVRRFPVIDALLYPSVGIILAVSIVIFLTSLKDSSFLRYVQLFIFFLVGAIAILDVYNSFHGLGLVILTLIIGFRYGLFEKKPLLKIFLFIGIIFVIVEIAASLQSGVIRWNTGLDAIMYILVFIGVLYTIYSNEIIYYVKLTTEAENKLNRIEMERTRLQNKLDDLDLVYRQLTQPADLDSMGITPREMEVIEALVVYRERDRALAERLGISPYTLKEHMKHIRDKLGVDRRDEIVDMCRNNFS